MAQMSKHHQELTAGVGKCSVPMWSNGLPDGFCDAPAYGEQTAAYRADCRLTGLCPSYAPGLACPAHGGPSQATLASGQGAALAAPPVLPQPMPEDEGHRFREALADLCGLRDSISDDVDLIEIGRHPDTGEWRVWHQDYPDEGSIPLVALAAPTRREVTSEDHDS